jgi:hypothetical protein
MLTCTSALGYFFLANQREGRSGIKKICMGTEKRERWWRCSHFEKGGSDV